MNEKLYPELSETGKTEAINLIERFKYEMESAINQAAKKAMTDFYSDIMPYIESDSWTNFRQSITDGISGYNNLSKYDAKRIRESIYKEYKNEIIKDLNQDNLEEIENLKQQIQRMYQMDRY